MPVKAVVFDAYGTLYDPQSVATVTDRAYPGYGEMITQVWRIKQLEYTWLRSLMQKYEDFESITSASLRYTLKLLGLPLIDSVFTSILEKYRWLDPYPEAHDALEGLAGHDLAILSNGSPNMLNELVRNTGFDRQINHVISVDPMRIYKPSPLAYALIETRLGVQPSEVMFVSSNPFDACGAKAFGLKVAWIDRVPSDAMVEACKRSDRIAPVTMFRAVRQQMDELGFDPDHRISSLTGLADLLQSELLG
ncbi:haloacid dehalogenase, type II [Roseibium algicola]|uniref:(S)-2-haloacid dehalogenase n=1 Tax=Roseibium algicola TaxID=2857014 RepID=A0ABM6I0N1_9HYPH|nr:haloacid dehalogenase type II [Roseibium aggregatum]AQQ03891.1 haloacid dehalogenase, type II [Roseibium aggregatum]